MQHILRLSERVQTRANIADLERKADEAWMRQDFDAADNFAEQAHKLRGESLAHS